MSVLLPLAEMTTAEKLEAMEVLWADLSRDETSIPSPLWHEEVLRERQARQKSGEEMPVDWEVAKADLRKRFR